MQSPRMQLKYSVVFVISHYVYMVYLDRLKTATNFLPIGLASLKPSEKSITSAICSLSGRDMATGRNSCLRLSGSFCRPP